MCGAFLLNAMEKQLFSIQQSAEVLSISPWTVRLYVKRGLIPSVKIGTRRLIRASDIDRMVSEGLQTTKSVVAMPMAA
jgi:excisionase family DNA binding protein